MRLLWLLSPLEKAVLIHDSPQHQIYRFLSIFTEILMENFKSSKRQKQTNDQSIKINFKKKFFGVKTSVQNS
jgi:hypothetical protein